MTPEDTEDAFAFTTFTPAATGTVERSGRWVSTKDGSPLYIEDGVAKTGPSGRKIDIDSANVGQKKSKDSSTQQTAKSKDLKSSDIGDLPKPKRMRVNTESLEESSHDVFRLANSGKSADEIADALLSDPSGPELYDESDFDALRSKIEKHVDAKLSGTDGTVTIDGQPWEDFQSDAAYKIADETIKPVLTAEVKKILSKPPTKQTVAEIESYLVSFGKVPVSKTQHAQKIMDRWPISKADAEMLVASKLGK